MADQVKLNDGDICHLVKVSSWLLDAVLFPVSFYPINSVDSKLYLRILLLVLPSLCTALEMHD